MKYTLTENKLKDIIRESVKSVLYEAGAAAVIQQPQHQQLRANLFLPGMWGELLQIFLNGLRCGNVRRCGPTRIGVEINNEVNTSDNNNINSVEMVMYDIKKPMLIDTYATPEYIMLDHDTIQYINQFASEYLKILY